MTLMAGLLAILAAVGGSLIWAGITYVTGYQIGWMAIGVGALVGAGARLGGGEGKVTALFCGGLALAAMFFGNVAAVQIALNKAINETAQEVLSAEAYEAEFTVADEFVYTPEEEYANFVFENTYYSAAASPDEVTDAEIQLFLTEYAPELRRLHEERPSYRTWHDQKYSYMKAEIMEGANISGFVFENIGVIGALFMVMGLFAAIRVVGEWE